MAEYRDFESRRRERIRKRRRRKKRIRTAVFLIILVALASVLIFSVSKCSNRTESVPEPTASVEPTATPEPVSTIPPASEENDLLNVLKDSGQVKKCYLTFDDGPTENITPQILDTLRKYNIKATFFEVGSLIEKNPDMARRVYEEGHLIAGHSYSHDYNKLYATEESFRSEVEKTYDIISSVVDEGDEMFKLMRFPGGSYNAGDHASEKQVYKKTLAKMGFYHVDWNTLNGDAEGKKKNAAELLEYLKKNTSTKLNNLVVLMHDASAKQATADALESIIQYLADEGYTFHRLDDIEYGVKSSPSPSPSAEADEADDIEEY